MAILKNGIMGPISNKIGTVIGRNFRGQNVITQLYRKSQKLATEDQKRGQYRLGILSSFLSRAQSIVIPGFTKTTKGGQSPLNAAYAFNYKHAFIEEEQEFKINYPQIVLSRGPVERPNCASVRREGNSLIFTWLPQPENMYSRFDDIAKFLIYRSEKKKMLVLNPNVLRSYLRFEFELPKPFHEAELHCYMIFNTTNGKLVGNSEYIPIST